MRVYCAVLATLIFLIKRNQPKISPECVSNITKALNCLKAQEDVNTSF